MASVTRISRQRWRIRISRGTGKARKIHSFNFTGSYKEALRFAVAREQDIDSGTISFGSLTFEILCSKWLGTIKHTVSPRTLDGYAGYLNRYAQPVLNALDITLIRPHHIQQIYNNLNNQGFSPRTIRQLHATLSNLFRWAEKTGLIKRSPVQNLTLPRNKQGEITILTPEELQAFLNACRTMKYGLIFELALETGMRPEEYLALRWSDYTNGEIFVRQIVQANRAGGGFYFAEPKTSRSRRRIPLSEELQNQLARHKTNQNVQRLKTGPAWQDHNLIFSTNIGTPILLSNLTKRYFRPILEKAGLVKDKSQRITLYSLRHTCASLLLLQGVNPKVVAERLGHANIQLTLNTYSHILPGLQAEATERISTLLRANL